MTPRKYGAEDARAHLPELLDEAHRGVPTLITKHGRPYAMLVPVEQARAPKRRVAVLSLAGTGVGLWGSDPAGTIAAMRDEWS
jgi:prevent-host-death family protein